MSAILWFMAQGAAVFLPIGHSPHFDLIADSGEGLKRVQVRTSTCFVNGRWDVTVCTRGGNQSCSGLVKYLDPAHYDYLFVLVGDGRRWLVPASDVGGACGVRLGGPKYAAYEIEPGQPLLPDPSSLDSAPPRRDSGAVKRDGL
jgi:hypothetical protein